MPPLYITEQGAMLRHEDRRLIVEKDDQTLEDTPLAQVDEVVLVGNATITTPTMKLLLYQGVDTVFLTLGGEYCGRLVGPLTRYGELRRLQYACANDESFTVGVAQACVIGKLRNLRTLLMRYNRDLNDESVAQAVERLAAQIEAAAEATAKPSLLGIEGAGTAAYFGVFGRLFKRDWSFTKRVRRPPPDPVNVLLSFAYTLLAKHLEAAVNLVGLDPYTGFLHELVYGRPSLALDLMEEFRPIVADSVVLRCLNNDLIAPDDFTRNEDDSAERPIMLSQTGSKRLIAEFEARLAAEFTHPATQERVTYRRIFELQTRALARAIRHRIAYQPFVVR